MRSMFAAMLPQQRKRPTNVGVAAQPKGQGAQGNWAVMCDIDHFRQYNDIYGPAAGEDVQRRIFDAVAGSCRAADIVLSRKGAGVVMVVAAGSLQEASACAERHRHSVEALQIAHQGSPFGVVTVSIGLATIMSDGGAVTRDALEAADAALDRAKNAGCNQVAAAIGLAVA